MADIEIVDGVFLRRSGARDGGKLVCLHAFADSGLTFTPLFGSRLDDTFELILVDLPGFGASPRKPGVGTIDEHGRAVAALVERLSPGAPVGLIGHSVASAVAVAAVDHMRPPPLGVFSIEGNLCEEDAYFSGRAADWDDPDAFKARFLDDIWEMAQTQPILRRYHAGAVMADAVAMWRLGRDARRVSRDDAVGRAYRGLGVPSLYYWSRDNTPAATQSFIAASGLANAEFSNASHWPTIDATEETAEAILGFFSQPPA